MIKYGFIRPTKDERDFVLGGVFSLPKVVLNPSGNWANYLPMYEKQYFTLGDSYGCTIFGSLNALETIQNKIESKEYNYAERYNYNLVGVTPPGADPKKAADSIHKFGVIPQEDLPFVDDFNTFSSPRPVTQDLINKGKKWLEKYNFGYEWVYERGTSQEKKMVLIKECLKYSPLGISVCAWKMDSNGDYYSEKGEENNHWCLLYAINEDGKFMVFDSYDQTIKRLRPDHNIEYCMRYYLEKKITEEEKKSLISQILTLIGQALGLIKRQVDILEEKEKDIIKEPVKDMTNQEKLLKICIDALDTDVTPKDEIPDDVACAEVMSTLIQKVFPDFKIWPSTKDLDAKLFLDKRFKRTDKPNRGAIIISPRTATTLGHVGIFLTEDRIASNSSIGKTKGLFIGNYTWDSWIKEFKVKRGLRIYLYNIV